MPLTDFTSLLLVPPMPKPPEDIAAALRSSPPTFSVQLPSHFFSNRGSRLPGRYAHIRQPVVPQMPKPPGQSSVARPKKDLYEQPQVVSKRRPVQVVRPQKRTIPLQVPVLKNNATSSSGEENTTATPIFNELLGWRFAVRNTRGAVHHKHCSSNDCDDQRVALPVDRLCYEPRISTNNNSNVPGSLLSGRKSCPLILKPAFGGRKKKRILSEMCSAREYRKSGNGFGVDYWRSSRPQKLKKTVVHHIPCVNKEHVEQTCACAYSQEKHKRHKKKYDEFWYQSYLQLHLTEVSSGHSSHVPLTPTNDVLYIPKCLVHIIEFDCTVLSHLFRHITNLLFQMSFNNTVCVNVCREREASTVILLLKVFEDFMFNIIHAQNKRWEKVAAYYWSLGIRVVKISEAKIFDFCNRYQQKDA